MTASTPSVISIVRSAARSRKVWVVRLVGQDTSSAATCVALAQADQLDQAVAAEAGVVADRAVDRPRRPIRALRLGLDAGPDRRAIGLGADQLDLQPVAAVAGVPEQEVVRPVARNRTADLDEQVEVAVAVLVGEGDAVPLLKMAGTRGQGHVQKPPARLVLEHQVGDEVLERHPAGPEIEVEIAVVVDVAEVAAHRRHGPVETDLAGDVAEAVGAEVSVEPGAARPARRQAARGPPLPRPREYRYSLT